MTPSSTTSAEQSAPKLGVRAVVQHSSGRACVRERLHLCCTMVVQHLSHQGAMPSAVRSIALPATRATFLQGSTSLTQPARSPGKAKSALYWRSAWPTPRRLVHAASSQHRRTLLCPSAVVVRTRSLPTGVLWGRIWRTRYQTKSHAVRQCHHAPVN